MSKSLVAMCPTKGCTEPLVLTQVATGSTMLDPDTMEPVSRLEPQRFYNLNCLAGHVHSAGKATGADCIRELVASR